MQASFDEANRDVASSPPSADSPRGAAQTLSAYGGGHEVDAEVVTPATIVELRRALVAAGKQGRRIIVRGGGRSIDDRGLGDDLVISTLKLDAIAIDEARAEVTVGPGATWGRIVASLPPGLVPFVVVTSSSATAGGTLAADCISRFSPAFSRESSHVKSFSLLTLDGRTLRCTPNGEGADVFAAVTAGVGFLGVITSITYELYDLRAVARRDPAQRQVRVETRVQRAGTFEGLVAALLDGEGGARRGEALYAVGSLDGSFAVHRSRYVAGSTPLRALPISERPTPLRLALECAAWSPRVAGTLWRLILDGYYRVRRTFVDDLYGFTFCMDANSRAIELARRAGAEVRLVQQTFVIPASRADREASIERVAGFLREVASTFDQGVDRAKRLTPALLDVLPLPARTPRERGGLAVSLAFLTRHGAEARAIAEHLERLSDVALELGGHVHLVKSVHARPSTLRAMHGERFERFFEVKQRLDPRCQLRNAFFDRIVAPLTSA